MTPEHQTKLTNYQSKQLREHRDMLQRDIIGAVLLESAAYTWVNDILTPKNFTGHFRHIWEAINTIADSKPIDVRTVHHQLLTLADITAQEAALLLTYCIQSVNSSASIRTHALLLVELSITDIYIDLLKCCEPNKHVDLLVEETLEAFYTEKDKLFTIERAAAYMEKVLPEADFTRQLLSLQKALAAKVEQIKKAEKQRTAIESLYHLSRSNSRVELRELTDLLIHTINAPKIPPAFTTQLFTLKKLLQA